MGWLFWRLVGWALLGAFIAIAGAAAWHGHAISSAGFSLRAVPPLTMALEVMQLHWHAAAGAGVGLLLGLSGRVLRRLRLRLRGLLSRDPAPAERPDPDALIRAERSQRADDYLSTLEQRTLDNVAVAADGEEPDVENIITARDGLYTYRVMAYRHLTLEERMQVVKDALERGHVREPEPGGTATLMTSIGKPE